MFRSVLYAKIHRLKVTRTDLEYEGSITIAEDLLEAAGLLPGEKVHVLNVTNASRFETYVIAGKRGSGEVCLNGAAARLGMAGDLLIVLAYCLLDPKEIASHRPRIVKVDSSNKVAAIES